MPRPSTAEQEWSIPGRDGKFVRLHRPAAGKSSWRVLYPDPVNPALVREMTRRDRGDAERLAVTLLEELALDPDGPERGREPLARLVDYYMSEFGDLKQWSAGYRHERARTVRWLPPEFLALPVNRWRVRHSDEVLAGVARAGYPFGTREYWRVGTVLSGLVTAGRRADFLDAEARSPMHNVRYQMYQSKRRATAREQQRGTAYPHVQPVQAFEIPGTADIDAWCATALQRTGQYRWWAWGQVLAYTGLREAEGLRLTVADVVLDPQQPHIHVWRQLVELRRATSPTGQTLLTEEPPKNNLPRDVWYPYEQLGPVLERLVAEALARDVAVPPAQRLLWPAPRGGFMPPSRYRTRVFNPTATALGWERVAKGVPHPDTGTEREYWRWPTHSFRHHAATWMLKTLGLHPRQVADYLGHEDSAFTERLYVDRSRFDATDSNARWREYTRRRAS